MSNVNWSTAPEGAEFYSWGSFFKTVGGVLCYYREILDDWPETIHTASELHNKADFESRPTISVSSTKWPETDERIDRIGRDRTEDDLGHYNAPERATIDEVSQPVSAADFLSEGLKTLSERAKQYDPSGKKELSFEQVAQAFNAVTGKAITGADVCLMLVMLKIVRQNAAEGFHLDSAVDGVNYMALWAELLNSSDHTQLKTAP
ncbi:MAG: hypothetical protein [Podoviridae sp. ctKoA10]|nr:MAG: hypothetical protein [Podoviridae sp. ctKoA10]